MYSALDLETKDHLFVLDLNENKKTVMFCYNQSGRIHNTIIYYEQFLISNKHTDTVKEGLRLCQNNFESLVVASQGNTQLSNVMSLGLCRLPRFSYFMGISKISSE